eukprot:UN33723
MCALLRDHFEDYPNALKHCEKYLVIAKEDPDGHGMRGYYFLN